MNMDTAEKNLDPAESLQLIASVIARTKENLREHSFVYLLWGWLIASASVFFFLLKECTSFRAFFLPFPLAALIGIGVTIPFYRRLSRTVETYLVFYLARLWLVLGIAFILVVVVNVYEGTLPFRYTMLIAGIGTLVSGLVMRFRPLLLGGVLFLILMLSTVFVPGKWYPLLQSFGFVLGYLVPGYLLKNTKS